jgi:prostaglandin-endoperoxide synthase 2
MVAKDVLSKALTNPLVSGHVWGNHENRTRAFTMAGLDPVASTRRLRAILARNARGPGDRFVGMSREA